VQPPAKFDLTINLNTAKALGITITETLLATADECARLVSVAKRKIALRHGCF
jgi:hypothetical protein